MTVHKANAGPSSQEDFSYISDLLETIEYDPSNLEVRWLLAQTYELYGWLDEAAQLVQQVLALSPENAEATAWMTAYILGEKSEPSSKISHASPAPASHSKSKSSLPSTRSLSGGVKDMERGYRHLMTNAKELMEELQVFQELCPELDISGQVADLKAITEGRFRSVVKVYPPPHVREVAQNIKSNHSTALEVAFADLEANARWLRTQDDFDGDAVREGVRKRAEAINASLPPQLVKETDRAFMHIEHEILSKTYQNEDGYTMCGDLISSIPRSNFWVTEDGYAWDMEELANAIKANNGVMRNPLSNQMFTADDVKAIVAHPLGKGLAALRLKQQQLTKGIRSDTINRLGVLASVIMEDQEWDASVSRTAVDEFVAYSATLPQAEQDALQNLRVPAVDSHTRQAFDMSIGQAVADAKANRLCWHKTADLLNQAVTHLQSNRR